MRTNDFNYELPQELIAQEPLENRDSSRMLVLKLSNGKIEHSSFKRLPFYLEKEDLLVLNNTKVLPARLLGHRKDTGGRVEFLLLHPATGENSWEVLCSPGKKVLPGNIIIFGNGKLEAVVLDIKESGARLVRFFSSVALEEVLEELGHIPLPPYIKKRLPDAERYQTVYGQMEGSAAAHTAGLHFTPSIFECLQEKGVDWTYLTLHIGIDTFRPVKAEYVQDHDMHSEYFELSHVAAEKINTARDKGKKVVAVGTTCCRVLETMGDDNGKVKAGRGETDIFIYPGYHFKMVDALITNFHLPRSTLLMLVSAFAGREKILEAYQEAIKQRYRFFSFGDVMLII